MFHLYHAPVEILKIEREIKSQHPAGLNLRLDDHYDVTLTPLLGYSFSQFEIITLQKQSRIVLSTIIETYNAIFYKLYSVKSLVFTS